MTQLPEPPTAPSGRHRFQVIADTLRVAVLALISKAVALGKESVVSATFGISTATDAYFVAFNIPSVIFTAVATSVWVVFMPLYTARRTQDGAAAGQAFGSNVIGIYVAGSLVLSFAGIAAAPTIVALLAPGFDLATRDLTTDLTRILLLVFPVTIAANILMAMQNSHRDFVGPQLVPIVNNLFVILSVVLLASRFGIHVVAVAAVLGWALQIPLQARFLAGRFAYRPHMDLKDPGLSAMTALLWPVLLGTAVNQANVLVDTILAARLDVGSVSTLNYANRILSAVSGVVVLASTTVIFPVFAELAAGERIPQLKSALRQCVTLLVLASAPITVLAAMASRDIVAVVFERGAFDAEATARTAPVFALLALSMIPYAVRDVLGRVFYALHDTRTPMLNGAAAVGGNVLLSLLLVRPYGAAGLALATGLAGTIACVLLYHALVRRIGAVGAETARRPVLAVLAGSSVMVVVAGAAQGLLPTAGMLRLVLVAATAGSAYLAVLAAFRIREVTDALEAVRTLLNPRRAAR